MIEVKDDIPQGELVHWTYLLELTSADFANIRWLPSKEGHGESAMTVYTAEIIMTYDIETSSFFDEFGNKVVTTYSHVLNINGMCFFCRTWAELILMFEHLKKILNLSHTRRLPVYVHNLSYEFQFMKGHLNFSKVFHNGGPRKIAYALISDFGIMLRCSYMLAGASLAVVAKNLNFHSIKKMEGDLDYSLVRSSDTPLTEEELGYILNDVLIIQYYLQELLDSGWDYLQKLPMTSTGFVRMYTRNKTIRVPKDAPRDMKKEAERYRDLMRNLTLTSEEYLALKAAFAGGYTHANATYVRKTLKDILAKDFASSYPARMIAYQYPMGAGEPYECTSKEDFFEQLENYCCLFEINFIGLDTIANESYWSASKTTGGKGITANNGRVVSAVELKAWMTDVDLECMMMSYEIDDFQIGRMWRYQRGYLPTPLIEAVLKLYYDKTAYKGLAEHVVNYNMSKAMLNSLYGMCVQDIVQPEIDWNPQDRQSYESPYTDIDEKIRQYNESKNRFLFYPWGVWITAYARFDLFQDIVALGDDYVYADTDSIYYKAGPRAEAVFAESNQRIIALLQDACDHHGFDIRRVAPKDPSGKERMIGIWSHDGSYTRFKTLGAKRYMVEKEVTDKETGVTSLKIDITVSGVNKKTAVPYILEHHEDPFKAFDHELHIPEGYCGKSTHTFLPGKSMGESTDYLGNTFHYEQMYGIHLEETYYSMTIGNEFQEYLEALVNKEAHLA